MLFSSLIYVYNNNFFVVFYVPLFNQQILWRIQWLPDFENGCLFEELGGGSRRHQEAAVGGFFLD